MHLKSLELFGFKSFAQKTTFEFHTGVTAIVGPNGCGKSNVLDAMRWVLGEQSAKALRGGEMADVIFSGTDSRQAVGMAEVSLTFANCEKDLGVEWNEVRITRRVFRDGRSEYLLNKTPCRLRDIHNLFMDTGIGRSAYSIMEQGKIDMILSSRPEDRRAIFEEAAGITKYKTQKKEALRKLEYTEANLIRITDIIREVKRQIGSLQRQAGKARRYQGLLEDLRTLDGHYSKYQFDTLQAQIAAATEESNRLAGAATSREEQIEALDEDLVSRRLAVEAIERRIAEARQGVQDLRNKIAAAQSRSEFNAERIAEAGELSDRYRRDIEAAQEKLKVQEDQILETDSQLELLLESLRTEQDQLGLESNRHGEMRQRRATAERELQELVGAINRASGDIARLRAEIAGAIQQTENSTSRLGILDGEIAQHGTNRQRLETELNDGRNRLIEARQKLDQQKEEVRTAEIAQRETEQFARQADVRLSDTRRALAERESKLEVLRGLVEAGEGLNEGAQEILKGLDDPDLIRPAIVGSLAGLLEVKPEFIPAIEAALGQNLHAIVIKDAEIARSAAIAMSTRKRGRASIASRGLIPSPAHVQMESLPAGATAWALDSLRADPEIAPLITELLTDVLVVPDIDTAIQLRQSNPRWAFATIGGEFVTREGVIHTGQAGGPSNSLLERKVQIRELEAEAAQYAAAAEESQAALAAAREAAEAAVQKAFSAREAFQSAQVAVSTIEGEVSLLEREFREVSGKLETLQWENQSLRQSIESVNSRLEELRSRLAAKEEEVANAETRRSETQVQLEGLREQEAILQEQLNELRVRVATGAQRREALSRQRQPMTARVAELTDLIAQRNEEIGAYAARVQTLEQETATLRENVAAWETARAEAEQALETIVAERAQTSEGLGALEEQLRAARKEVAAIQEERGKQDILRTQLELRLESLNENVARRYSINLAEFVPDSYAFSRAVREQQKRASRAAAAAADDSEAAPEPAAEDQETKPADVAPPVNDIDWNVVAELVREMTAKLDAMGPVNLDAIQEYDELEERHTFLESQFADLENSKRELLEVISKINKTTRELFAETFEKVRVNFAEMFTELFGGGKANLILQDESDPLESGIEIIARPPGKQLQSISLLSGGEKTMTAVSLLFAIYMVKPSPFCVLDEMDAPLDESNINRFIKILDRFVAQSQFVVITHNKRTIARADVLYGVTMEEHGVSKPVGVRLSKHTGKAPSEGGTDLASHTGGGGEVPSVAESFGKHGNLHSETVAPSQG